MNDSIQNGGNKSHWRSHKNHNSPANPHRKTSVNELTPLVNDKQPKGLPTAPSYILFGPRIGVYYGVVVDQDHLDKKVEPMEIAAVIETVTGLSPLTSEATWRLDYDHSQCYKTFVIYHQDYTKITSCPGFIGGWSANGNTKQVPTDVSNMAETLSAAIEKILYPYVDNETSYAIVAVGYCAVYFVD